VIGGESMRIRIERSWSDDRGELHELFKVIRNAPLQAGYRFATFHYEGRIITPYRMRKVGG